MKNKIKYACTWCAYSISTLYFLIASIGCASTGNTVGFILNTIGVTFIFIFAIAREISRRTEIIPMKADSVDHLLYQLTDICKQTGYTDEMMKRYPNFVDYLQCHGFIRPDVSASQVNSLTGE